MVYYISKKVCKSMKEVHGLDLNKDFKRYVSNTFIKHLDRSFPRRASTKKGPALVVVSCWKQPDEELLESIYIARLEQ